MALYKSKYMELSFYVGKERKQFSNGEYRTGDKKEIEALDSLIDVIKFDEPKKVAEETAPKAKPKAPAKKSSGK